jgi:hypothetical protein
VNTLFLNSEKYWPNYCQEGEGMSQLTVCGALAQLAVPLEIVRDCGGLFSVPTARGKCRRG